MKITETRIENGIRQVLNKEDGEFYPDMKTEYGMTFILDEREGRFQYYPLSDRELTPQEITPQMRAELMNEVVLSEERIRQRQERGEFTEAEIDLLPLEEQMKYEKQGEYMKLKEPSPANGKYAALRREYLIHYQPKMFKEMTERGTLNAHLTEIQTNGEQQVLMITEQLAKREGIATEQLKSADQMHWTALMNGYRNQAEEIFIRETVYSEEQTTEAQAI